MGKKDRLREAERRFLDERDRRYTEVNIEREKALRIKERADEVALGLAREIQTYKDEKANELREQINSERGIYATRSELKPVQDYIVSQTGQREVIGMTGKIVVATISAIISFAGIAVALYVALK